MTDSSTLSKLPAMLSPTWRDRVREWLKDDVPGFDYGGAVVGAKETEATLLCKAPGVLAGVPFFDAVFEELGCSVSWSAAEGDRVGKAGAKVPVATVRGAANRILLGERTALQLISRASGIASMVDDIVAQQRLQDDEGVKHTKLSGTRKTTPGLRLLEKYALLVGGADTHRMDLSSMIMLKDNHIVSAGSITKAVEEAKRLGGFAIKVEVECARESHAEEAAKAGADVLMLDNFDADEAKAVAGRIKAKFPHIIIEASGGIVKDTFLSYCSEHIDVISMGGLTQNVHHVDFSLKIGEYAAF